MAILKPESLALTVLLALITAIGPLATDMYLPLLPTIRDDLGATTADVQATLSGFLIGYALAQLFYGPISDRKGRKPAMIAGLLLFMLGSLGCALAPTISWLIGARVLQALGGAGSVVLARAMVRDSHEGARAGRELARIGSIMALVPALAPMAGAAVGALAGWRSVFYVMAALGPLILWLVHFHLPETVRQPLATPFSLREMFRDFRTVLRVPSFRYYAALGSLSFAGFFCFLSGGSFVLQQVYGLSERAFAASFALPVLGYMSGAMLAQRKVMAWGIDRTIRMGVLIGLPAALAMLAGMLTGIGGPWAVLVPMTFYQVGFGLILSQCNAGALVPFADRAGGASSLFSVTQMGLSALVGALVGAALDRTALALPLGLSVCALLMAFAVYAGRSTTRST
ncbi:MAG: multidrug effflux MFS transporter [Proteobacteria bacterium]|nr:multidrug effflux MFS transporter [Pseudomonadota bacterium]